MAKREKREQLNMSLKDKVVYGAAGSMAGIGSLLAASCGSRCSGCMGCAAGGIGIVGMLLGVGLFRKLSRNKSVDKPECNIVSKKGVHNEG